jgi:hypothetical protein
LYFVPFLYPLRFALALIDAGSSQNSLVHGVSRRCGNIPSGDEPHPVPLVWRTDGTSRNNKRLDGVSFTLKVCTYGFDDELLFLSVYVVVLTEERGCDSHFNCLAGLYHREDASNVLTNDESGLYLPDCS